MSLIAFKASSQTMLLLFHALIFYNRLLPKVPWASMIFHVFAIGL